LPNLVLKAAVIKQTLLSRSVLELIARSPAG
jgi:hypothetical protein